MDDKAIEAAARAISVDLLGYEDEWERYADHARAAIAAYHDAEIADLRAQLSEAQDNFAKTILVAKGQAVETGTLRAKLEEARNAKRIAEERELEAAQEIDDMRTRLEAAELDASQLREAASAMLDKIDYNINNERLPLTYTVPWEQAVALRRAVRKETAIDAARGGS